MRGVRTALAVLVVSRVAIFLVGYLAVVTFGYVGGGPPVRDVDSELLNLPFRFDARWYLQIATSGYAYDPHAAADVQQNIVFFPAYPIAIRLVALLFGGGTIAPMIGATCLSLAAFGAALVYLRAFAVDFTEHADVALWLLAWYPFAIFYGAIYTESLFLLAALGAMYHFRRHEDGRAALWGFVAGLTRPNGFLVAAPLALQAAGWIRSSCSTVNVRAVAVRQSVAIGAPVAGVLAYSLYLSSWVGDPWAWARGHVAWGRTYQGLTTLVVDRGRMIANAGLGGYLTALPHDALNAAAALFSLATIWPVARRVGPSYAIWMLLNILPPLAAGGLISAGRFTAVLFPSFVWLASAIPERHRAAWVGTFAVLQALCAAMFYTWRPLY